MNIKNKKRKGFTLIELLVVILLITIISLIAYPEIKNVFKNVQKREYQKKIDVALEVARSYGSDKLNAFDGKNYRVTIGELIEEGYLNSEVEYEKVELCDGENDKHGCIINPTTKESINNECIKIIKNDNEYITEQVDASECYIKNYLNINVRVIGNGKVSPASQVVGNGNTAYVELYPAGDHFYANNTCGGVVINNVLNIYNVTEDIDCSVRFSRITEVATFNYENQEQIFIAPRDGYYRLEAWGAQGGDAGEIVGGYGGYSRGLVYLLKDEILYINVGGKGATTTTEAKQVAKGGYNGGGDGKNNTKEGDISGGGGGATSIAKVSGLLSTLSKKQGDLLIVAGGGGGSYYRDEDYHTIIPGNGGGFEGVSGTGKNKKETTTSAGGTQKKGKNNAFGLAMTLNGNYRPGGGGGYYGGHIAGYTAAGGSGYIANPKLLFEKYMICYECNESVDKNTRTISISVASSIPESNQAKKDNGAVRITYLGLDILPEEENIIEKYEFTGTAQEFHVPATGIYKIELWGGSTQGGSYKSATGNTITYGAYVSGNVKLSFGQTLYVFVGQRGIKTAWGEANKGGWNGGGKKSGAVCTGGGGTDVRLYINDKGEWDNADSLSSRIMVAGGAGGCGSPSGDAGLLVGGNNNKGYGGGTQTAGGTGCYYSDHNGKNGLFGKGATNNCACGAGGGGGWFGGGAGCHQNPGGQNRNCGASGGSSYVNGIVGYVYKTNNYYNASDYVFTNYVGKTGVDAYNYRSERNVPVNNDGYAIISYVPQQ